MKHFYVLTLTCCFFLNFTLAQLPTKLIHFKNGNIDKGKNLLTKKITSRPFKDASYNKKYFILVQFDKLPGIADKNELSSHGIFLFDYLPGNAFLTEVRDSAGLQELRKYNTTGIYNVPGQFKISSGLLQHDETDLNSLVAVSFFGTMDKTSVIKELQETGANIVFTKIQPSHVVFIKGSINTIKKIAALPFVSYICKQSLEDVPLNYNNRAIHGLDALSALSGRNLQGRNLTLGIGDNADPSTHIDFSGRLIQRNATIFAAHGTHTTGTMAGGGIINPKYKGMAPKATIVSQYFSDMIVNTPVYIHDYNMVLTNNSYFTGAASCPGDGDYDALSNFADSQLNANPSLLHVFAAGNDGGLTCNPYPSHFATIKSGFQCSKNILTVGNMNNATYTISAGSSKGPVADGRIKPEIVAGGQGIICT